MRKRLLVVGLVVAVFLVTIVPVSAKHGGGGGVRPPGQEPPYGPPGWSHVNPGGGSDATMVVVTMDRPENPPGQGDPPGWSHQNPGQGGSGIPGPGGN